MQQTSSATSYPPQRCSKPRQSHQDECKISYPQALSRQPTRVYPLRSKNPVAVSSVDRSVQRAPIQSIEAGPFTKTQATHGVGINRHMHTCQDTRDSSRPRRTLPPLPVPMPTKDYLNQARSPSAKLPNAQKLLVVLDLNGTLIYRTKSSGNPTKHRVRPGTQKFLAYLFKEHLPMVYTSMQPETTKRIVPSVFSEEQARRLVAVWARDMLDMPKKYYFEKVQVYKRLDKIWRDKDIQSKHPNVADIWGQKNTVLIDDSHLKASAQPHNLVHVPEYDGRIISKKDENATNTKHEEEILDILIMKLEELKHQEDVSRLIFQWQTGKSKVPSISSSDVKVEEKTTEQGFVTESNAQQKSEPLRPTGKPQPLGLVSPSKDDALEDSDEELQQARRRLSELEQQISNMKTDRCTSRDETPIRDTVWSDLLSGKP